MKKLFAILMLMSFSLSLSLSSFASNEVAFADVNSLAYASPIEIITQYRPDKNVDYQISKQKTLFDFTGEPSYTVYALSPYGYAILLNSTNGLLEACYSEFAVNPIDMNSSIEYYYGGPGLYCVQEGNVFINMLDGTQLSDKMVANSVSAQAEVCAYETQKALLLAKTGTATLSTAATSTASSLQTHTVEYSYFSSLTDYGLNVNGTCTVIAIQMLLGYYDYFINDRFVLSSYESGEGTSEAFHQHLNSYVYAESEQGGIKIRNTAIAISYYLVLQGLNCEFHSEFSSKSAAIEKMIRTLQNHAPVVASMSTVHDALYDHSVLVYGVTYDPSNPVETAVFTMNTGWKSGTSDGQSKTEYLASAGWFYECGYIKNVCDGHLMTMWRDSTPIYHVRNCWYCDYVETGMHTDDWDQLLGKCTSCGRTGIYGGGVLCAEQVGCC